MRNVTVYDPSSTYIHVTPGLLSKVVRMEDFLCAPVPTRDLISSSVSSLKSGRCTCG